MIYKLTLFLIAYLAYCDEDFDIPTIGSSVKSTMLLYHSYDGVNWEERGQILISSHGDKRRRPNITVKNDRFVIEKVDVDGLYYVGIYRDEKNKEFLQSAIRSCNLIASDLLDSITIYLDQEKGSVLALNYQASIPGCAFSTPARQPQTSAEAGMVKEAMKPIYTVPKIEDPQEQQGFFRKYVIST